MTALSVSDVVSFKPPQAELTKENLVIAAGVLQQLWDEHQKSKFIKPDGQRVGSSAFASLLAREIFGGTLAGSSDHMFVLHGDIIVDLNSAQSDVKDLDALAHINIPGALTQESVREKLGANFSKVQSWAKVALEKINGPALRRRVDNGDSLKMSM